MLISLIQLLNDVVCRLFRRVLLILQVFEKVERNHREKVKQKVSQKLEPTSEPVKKLLCAIGAVSCASLIVFLKIVFKILANYVLILKVKSLHANTENDNICKAPVVNNKLMAFSLLEFHEIVPTYDFPVVRF